MFFMDCHCSFGCTARPPPQFAATAADLLAEMDFCGIDRALVYHANQRFASPVTWNSVLSESLTGQSRLEGAWAILPPSTGELPAPDLFLKALRSNTIRTLCAFPHEHHYRLDRKTLGGYYDLMAAHRIPLLVRENLLNLDAFLKESPDIIVMAIGQGPHSVERYLRPLLDAYPNLHLDTSAYMVEGLIEDFCGRYGPERLLFGSGFPDNAAGAALLRLATADIGAEARAAIAGGNIKRLLDNVRL